MASVQAFLSPHSFRNVTFDASSGTAIEWNILNLPRKITTSGGIVSEYTYLADGTKVRMKSGTSYLHYLRSMVFSQAGSATPVFESMAFAEGRIVVSSSGTREVHYHITDHLGSVRSVVKADGTVIAANDYYPYGKRINTASATTPTQKDRHTFSGKEDQALTPGGAPYLDFGARMYSAETGRWLSVDPMAEKYYGIGTHVYCAGNPVNLVDPDGKKIIIDIYGNIMSNDNNSSDIYVNQNDALTYIGELGGEVQITDVLSNLFQNSAKESRFMNPFTLRNLVKNGGDWDLKNNENTIWGIANKTDTNFIFNGESLSSADIGNFHFGVVTKSNIFITEDFALKQAGVAQIAAGTSLEEWQQYSIQSLTMSTSIGIVTLSHRTILPPYGDDPDDQEMIKRGFHFFND